MRSNRDGIALFVKHIRKYLAIQGGIWLEYLNFLTDLHIIALLDRGVLRGRVVVAHEADELGCLLI